MATAKELKECRKAIAVERADQAMYQRCADNATDDDVRRWNQNRANYAAEAADDYERWLRENS